MGSNHYANAADLAPLAAYLTEKPSHKTVASVCNEQGIPLLECGDYKSRKVWAKRRYILKGHSK